VPASAGTALFSAAFDRFELRAEQASCRFGDWEEPLTASTQLVVRARAASIAIAELETGNTVVLNASAHAPVRRTRSNPIRDN